jgi:hypothetical protein
VISCRSSWGTEASISSLMLMGSVDCTFKIGTTNSKAVGHAKIESKGQHNTERQFCTIIHDQIGPLYSTYACSRKVALKTLAIIFVHVNALIAMHATTVFRNGYQCCTGSREHSSIARSQTPCIHRQKAMR